MDTSLQVKCATRLAKSDSLSREALILARIVPMTATPAQALQSAFLAMKPLTLGSWSAHDA